MVVSFCGAAAVSWFTVTSGGITIVPSSRLDSTNAGVIGGAAGEAAGSAASCSTKPEKRTCRPAVPRNAATFPARVVMSYDGATACAAPGSAEAEVTKSTDVARTRDRLTGLCGRCSFDPSLRVIVRASAKSLGDAEGLQRPVAVAGVVAVGGGDVGDAGQA